MRAFTQADRFVTELASRKLRPAYVLVGDEAFFRKRCRDAILEHLVPADSATSACSSSIWARLISPKFSTARARHR